MKRRLLFITIQIILQNRVIQEKKNDQADVKPAEGQKQDKNDNQTVNNSKEDPESGQTTENAQSTESQEQNKTDVTKPAAKPSNDDQKKITELVNRPLS
ncbi:hypothetical protein AAULH_09458 [Lactobacillus helveticus MTCC 5463]|nr:hypothetical protein AAULH_09458 [Lactobacillus helveticus MTCC 5463]